MMRVSIIEQYASGTKCLMSVFFFLFQGVGMIVERHPDGKL